MSFLWLVSCSIYLLYVQLHCRPPSFYDQITLNDRLFFKGFMIMNLKEDITKFFNVKVHQICRRTHLKSPIISKGVDFSFYRPS